DDKKSKNAFTTTEFNQTIDSNQFVNHQERNFKEILICDNDSLKLNNAKNIAGIPSTLFIIPTETETSKTTPTIDALDCCDTGGPGIINKLSGAYYSMSYDAVSSEECCRKCSADSNCIGWGYNIQTKLCFGESINDPDADEFCKYTTDYYANFVGGRPGCGD
ncbi:1980_t:CDS:1, partial [Scutellospora calospora]